MSELSRKIAVSAEPTFNVRRIERQIGHIERALQTATNERQRIFLAASFQALQWARSPDSFAPPVQMFRGIA